MGALSLGACTAPGAGSSAADAGALGEAVDGGPGETRTSSPVPPCRADLGALPGQKPPVRIPSSLSIGGRLFPVDLDGDGDLDVVGSSFSIRAASTVLLRNDRAPTFVDRELGPGQLLLPPLDLDGDGDRDLLVDDGAPTPRQMFVRLADGTGNFAVDPAAEALPYATYMMVEPGVLRTRSINVAAGDLNGDGLPEIVTATQGFPGEPISWSLEVFINQGGGRLLRGPRVEGPPSAGFSRGPASVVVADLDGDRKNDLLLTWPDEVRVARNLGADRFELREPQRDLGTVGAVLGLLDADGDGDRDLFAESALLLAEGGGLTFSRAGAGVPDDRSVVAEAAGDIDGDGDVDMIGRGFGGFGAKLVVLRNVGAARFQREALSIEAGYGGEALALADLDGDRRAEILALGVNGDVGLTGPGQAGGVWLFWNGGAGVFPFGGLPTGGGPEFTIAADLDGDGDQDLASADTQGTVSVRRNEGGGVFSAAAEIELGGGVAHHPEGLASADLDGDGKLDLAVADSERELVVLLGQGALAFAPGPPPRDGTGLPVATFSKIVESVAAADLDGDGDTDLVLADGAGTSTLTVFTNDGAAGFSSAAVLPTGHDPTTVLALDIDRDGRIDLVSANEADDTVSVLKATGPLAFAPAEHHAVGRRPDALAAGDLDGDGFPDLVTANAWADAMAGVSEDTLTVLVNDGHGGFRLRSDIPAGRIPRGVAIDDLDGDGDQDLVAANWLSGDATVLLNDGHALFTTGPTVQSGPRPQGVVVTPVAGHCRPDIIVANKASSELRVIITPLARP